MSAERNVEALLDGYVKRHVSLGTLGSHSALDVAEGAKARGVPNFVVAVAGRELPYTEGFREVEEDGETEGCVQNVHVVSSWKELTHDGPVSWIRGLNGVFVPNRSLAVYLRDSATGSYDPILGMNVPFFGNIDLLQVEERDVRFRVEHDQDFLAREAGLPVPETIPSPDLIRGKSIVKASKVGTERNFERNFVIVSSPEEYQEQLEKFVADLPPELQEEASNEFQRAIIQRYAGDGRVTNLNFFYSPIRKVRKLQLLGTDTRTQFPSGEEETHLPNSLRESLYQPAFEMGNALVEAVRVHYPRGIIGPFAIQCIGDTSVVDGRRQDILRPIDLSLRIPGSPDTGITPPSFYLYGRRVSIGERIAMEVKAAVKAGRLAEVVS